MCATTTITATTENAEEIAKLEADLQKRAHRILKHMNDGHTDSIKAYSLAFGEDPRCAAETDSAILTGLDRVGFWLEVVLKDGTSLQQVRVPYQGTVASAKDLHMEAVNMHRQAYDKLGYRYKISTGYYTQVGKMVGFQVYKKVKANPAETAGIALGVAAIVGGIAAHRRR